MISMSLNADAFLAGFENIEAVIKAELTAKVKNIVYFIDERVHALTPVHTGEAVRNMIWSMDTPSGAHFDAIDTGPPGFTSKMALGPEPRRSANAIAAIATLNALSFSDPFHAYILHNSASDIGLIEEGSAGLDGLHRAPSGVFAITAAEVNARMQSGVL